MPGRKPAFSQPPIGPYHGTFSKIILTLDMLTGRSTGELQTLPANASLADVVAKINQIVERLNASTN
jgi:hypothetical protein